MPQTVSSSVEIPNVEPRELIAGDTWAWNRQFEDFPSSDWDLNYYLQGAQSFTIAAGDDPDGVTFNIAVPASGGSGTAGVIAGSYKWYARVSNATTGEVYTVREGDFKISPNLATAPSGSLQQNAEKMLVAVEAEISARMGLSTTNTTGGTASPATAPGGAYNEIEFQGRRLSMVPLNGKDSLRTFRAQLKYEISLLENNGVLPALEVEFGSRHGRDDFFGDDHLDGQ